MSAHSGPKTCWSCGNNIDPADSRRRWGRCSDCTGGRRERVLVAIGAVVVFGFVLILLLAARQQGIAVWKAVLEIALGAPVLVIVMLFLSVTSIAIHELGHACVGTLLGFRIVAFRIGLGRVVRTFTVRGTSVDIHVVPLAGEIEHTPPENGASSWASAAVIASGPAASGCAGLVGRLWSLPDGGLDAVWTTFVFLNLGMCVINLVPIRGRLPTGEPRESDGLQLIHLLRRPWRSEREKIAPK